MKKRRISLLLTLVFALALGACGTRNLPADVDSESVSSQSVVQNEVASAQHSEAIDRDGEYTSRDDVALYIYTYSCLPRNFITKNEARDLGWQSKEGNLWDVAPGMSIGGDYFGNYEGLLPDGDWRECDIDYTGGYRGAQRIIYGKDGNVYYTSDHYESFTQLY